MDKPMCVPTVTPGSVPAVDSAHALTADVSVAETAAAAELFLADGVVLTGTATGLPARPQDLAGESQHCKESASGVT